MIQHPEGLPIFSETAWGPEGHAFLRWRDLSECSDCGTAYPYRFSSTRDCMICVAREVSELQRWHLGGEVGPPPVKLLQLTPGQTVRGNYLARPCMRGPHLLTRDQEGNCEGCGSGFQKGRPRTRTRQHVEKNPNAELSRSEALELDVKAYRSATPCQNGHRRPWRPTTGNSECLNCKWDIPDHRSFTEEFVEANLDADVTEELARAWGLMAFRSDRHTCPLGHVRPWVAINGNGKCLACAWGLAGASVAPPTSAAGVGRPKSAVRLYIETNPNADMPRDRAEREGLAVYRAERTCSAGHARPWRRMKGNAQCLNCLWDIN